MYSHAVTAQVVDRVSREREERGKKPLIYHNENEIRHAIAHFGELFDPDTRQLTRALRPDEAEWIDNERLLCAIDFRTYWLRHYCWIVNWAKQPEQFTPNVAQQIVMDLWAEREEQGLAIWMQQLKARRLGVSTISELAVGHRYQFVPYTNAVVASADPSKTVQMAGMIKFNLDQQPWWLLPQGKPKIKAGIPVEFPDINTSLTAEAGNQFNGVARGATPNVVHLSELAEWRGAEDLVDAALMRAIIDTPDVFGIMESTGGGVGNWWHKTWEQNKRDWQRGRARVIPVFLPYFVGTDLYPSAADLRARPIPSDWIPSDRTIAHAERARAYVLSNPLLFKHLAKNDPDWQLPREQMWFREIEYETAKEKKQLNIFLAELCADDFEAFQSSNIAVIDQDVLIGYQERTRQPIACYTVIGPEIPPSLVVPRRQWDPNQQSITVRTRDVLPRLDLSYQLVPVKFEGYPTFDEQLKLLVWEPPSDEFTYGIGVDTSEGTGLDNAAIEVMREANPFLPPAQVAEMVYNRITAFQLWPIVLAIATWYSVYSARLEKKAQTKLCIECRGNGEACQYALQQRGWSNFHLWKKYDNKKPTQDAKVNKIGIFTNAWFRSQMMDMLLTCLDESAIDLPSPYLLQELQTLERDPDQQKAKAAYGALDDRVMSLGFPLFSLHMGKPPERQYARKKVEYAPGLVGDARMPHPTWKPPEQALSRTLNQSTRHLAMTPSRTNGRYSGLVRALNANMPKGYQ